MHRRASQNRDSVAEDHGSSPGSSTMSNIPPDSPISAADMLSRRSLAKSQSRANHSFVDSSFSPATRLFPDPEQTQRLGLTPTSRNHPSSRFQDVERSRSRRSSRLHGVDRSPYQTSHSMLPPPAPNESTAISYRIGKNAVPTTSTPFRKSAPVRSSRTPVQKRNTESSAPTPFRTPKHMQSMFSSNETGSSSTDGSGSRRKKQIDSDSLLSDSVDAELQRRRILATWGGVRDESPMDLLRRLAQAPGFEPTSSGSSSRSRSISSEQSQSFDKTGSSRSRQKARKVHQGSDLTTTPRPRVSVATSAPMSEAGQARRQGRDGSNIFHPREDMSLSSVSVLGRSSFRPTDTFAIDKPSPQFRSIQEQEYELSELQEQEYELSELLQREHDITWGDGRKDREWELERILAGELTRDGLPIDQTSYVGATGKDRLRNNIFENLSQEDEISLQSGEAEDDEHRVSEEDVDDEASVPNESSTQHAAIPFATYMDDQPEISYEQPEISYELASDGQGQTLDPNYAYGEPGQTQPWNQSPGLAMGEPASGLDVDQQTSTLVSRRDLLQDEEEDDDGVVDKVALNAARKALLRRRRSKRQKERLSSITGKPVATLPSALVKDLFCTFATPKSGIAQASIGKPPKRAKVDRLAQDAVEDLSHHFFSHFAQNLLLQAEQRAKSSTRITEADVVALLKAQGHISPREPLLSAARKYLPRELSDLITPKDS